MRLVSAEPAASVEREKLANQVSAPTRSERSRARSGSAVRIPLRRSTLVGPCVSSRSANSAAAAPFGTTRSTLTTQPFLMNATSTVSGAGFGTVGRAGTETAARDVADGSMSTARKPANANRRTTSRIRIGTISIRRLAQDACMATRTLTLRELNRATLARQLLLRRHRLSVTQAVERVAGLQAQWPPSPYIGLWSRLDGFTPGQLVSGVARRRVVKATLMRTTLHLVSAGDYLAYAGIYRERRIAELQRQLAALGEDADFATDGERLAAFAAERPRTRPELLASLGRPRLRIEERAPYLVWYGLAAYAGLVNGPSSSTWRGNTAGGTFVPARTWLGANPAAGAGAAAHLVRRYLAAFGPASRPDIAQWTGLPLGVLDVGLEQLRPEALSRRARSRARRSPSRAAPRA